jgi:taurine-pyruvate aminotransferase
MITKATEKDELLDGIKHIQLDFMQMESFIQSPRIFNGGKGIYLQDTVGREYVDAISGIFVVNIGYGNIRVKEALKRAVDDLEFWPPLDGTTPQALKMAKRLSDLLPKPLSVARFASGGSEATECAIKWARQYHVQSGNPLKYKVVSRHGSYHGATKGSLSASGVSDKFKFEPLAVGYSHVFPPNAYRCSFGCGGECNLLCADAIETEIKFQGPETVSAVMMEPIMTRAGVLVPPVEYFETIREVCDKYDVLLVFDEVVTGFGRVGKMFALDYYGVVPDIVCLAKGMASGYAPLSATVASSRIIEAFKGEESEFKQFEHGTTFGGHPLGCAAGLAVTEEIEREGLPGSSERMGKYMLSRLEELKTNHRIVGDVRGLGLLIGVEFVEDMETRKPFPPEKLVAPTVGKIALESGLIVRISEHMLFLGPPLIIKKDEIDNIIDILERCISQVEKDL